MKLLDEERSLIENGALTGSSVSTSCHVSVFFWDPILCDSVFWGEHPHYVTREAYRAVVSKNNKQAMMFLSLANNVDSWLKWYQSCVTVFTILFRSNEQIEFWLWFSSTLPWSLPHCPGDPERADHKGLPRHPEGGFGWGSRYGFCGEGSRSRVGFWRWGWAMGRRVGMGRCEGQQFTKTVTERSMRQRWCMKNGACVIWCLAVCDQYAMRLSFLQGCVTSHFWWSCVLRAGGWSGAVF